jgi:hypothetical protein
MSIKNTLQLSDSIGFIKYIGVNIDSSNRGNAASGSQITIQFKMPMCIAYDWFNAIGEIRVDSFSRSNIAPTSDYRIPYNIDNANIYTDSVKASIDAYNMLLHKGVMPEIARGILPQSMYIEFTETGSINGYMTFCEKFKDNILVGMYCKLVYSLIKEVYSSDNNIDNISNVKGVDRKCDDPAEYQWGC